MSGPFHLGDMRAAVLSDDRKHRYWLTRIWDRSLPALVVCMFNPSTADDRRDDPTIQRLCHFAKQWGYGGILVVNLVSVRSSDPSVVRTLKSKDEWGDAQHHALGHACQIAADAGKPILVAWGALPEPRQIQPFMAAAEGVDLICLGLTADGHPKHPMARGRHRVPDDQQPIPFNKGRM